MTRKKWGWLTLVVGLMAATGSWYASDVAISNSPTIVHSPKSPSEMMGCIKGWDSDQEQTRVPGGGLMLVGRNGAIYRQTGEKGVLSTMTIFPEGKGSRIEFRRRHFGMLGMGWSKCANGR